MPWSVTDDPRLYATHAGPLLRADPVTHAAALALLTRDEDACWAWWTGAEGRVLGAASLVRGELHLHAVPEVAQAGLVRGLAQGATSLRGAPGPTAQLALACARDRGATPVLRGCERLHRLERLVPPRDVAGSPRWATEDDHDLLATWLRLGAAETGARRTPQATSRLREGVVLWRDEQGVPVSMAATTAAVDGTASVICVFTPRPLRGRGHGAAVTAEAARRLQAAGVARVLLTADLSTPHTVRLYRALGFVPAGDLVAYDLR